MLGSMQAKPWPRVTTGWSASQARQVLTHTPWFDGASVLNTGQHA